MESTQLDHEAKAAADLRRMALQTLEDIERECLNDAGFKRGFDAACQRLEELCAEARTVTTSTSTMRS